MANYKNITQTDPGGSLLVSRTAQAILDQSDWTQLDDSGLTNSCKTAFATYRSAIRTIRKSDPANPTWPDAPTEEWL